jgi:nucleotide-binding universal stress UspA family protein
VTSSDSFAPRRILVALDASAGSLAALDAAAELAARVQAELLGLFVEDSELFRIARLPSARHVSFPSGAGDTLDVSALEAQLGLLAARARNALEAAGRKTHVSVRFHVARGRVAREVALAAQAADLLILGWAGRPLPRRSRPGRTAWAAAEGATRSVLLLPGDAGLEGPVLLVDDGGRGDESARRAAAQLAGLLRTELVVLAMEGSRAGMGEEAGSTRVRTVGTPERLRQALRQMKGGILALSAGSALVEDFHALLEETGRPVLLVR